MHSEKKIIVETLFNNWGKSHDRLTHHWIEYRINLFMKYTLRSLMLQSCQDFNCYVLFDPLSDSLIQEELSKHLPLPSNIRFVTPREYKECINNDIRNYKYYYRTYLSSDDMYHKDFIRSLHEYSPKEDTVALVPQYGYAYDSEQNRLGNFFFWLPGYGSIIVEVDKYLRGQAARYTWRDALQVPREFMHVKQPIWINHIHGKNTGTTFDNILRWRDKNVPDAFMMDPWDNGKKSRACFGPEITNPDDINAILGNYF